MIRTCLSEDTFLGISAARQPKRDTYSVELFIMKSTGQASPTCAHPIRAASHPQHQTLAHLPPHLQTLPSISVSMKSSTSPHAQSISHSHDRVRKRLFPVVESHDEIRQWMKHEQQRAEHAFNERYQVIGLLSRQEDTEEDNAQDSVSKRRLAP